MNSNDPMAVGSGPTGEEEWPACKNHPARQAVAACGLCGRFLCELCQVELNPGDSRCPECANAPVSATTGSTGSRSFGLFELFPDERSEFLRMVIGSAIIGGIIGAFSGGIWNFDNAVLGALSNAVIFGLWGVCETLGVMIPRNLGVRRRGLLLCAGALGGGVFVSLASAVGAVLFPTPEVPLPVAVVGSLIAGFVLGLLISAVCCIRVSAVFANNAKQSA